MKTWTGNLWGWLSLAAVIFLNVSLTAPAATLYVDANGTNPVVPYTSWATAATNIQDAVDAAVATDQVLVTNGVYQTGASSNNGSNRVNVAKALQLQSVNGPAVTVIKGYQMPVTTNGANSVRCVYLANGATLAGFTLTNGSVLGGGGGVYCQSVSATVSNCIITGNSCSSGGAGSYSGTYKNCSLCGNTSFSTGGGNNAGSFANCVFFGNSARSEGGGAEYPVKLVNCTVVGNSAGIDGGGVWGGTLANCLVYYNTSQYGSNIDNTTSVTNCCTYPTNSMNGLNITNPPAFVNLAGGDFHLQPWSPCINAGNNSFVTVSNDLDGNPRIVAGTVDIGAYEFQSPVRYVSVSNTAPVSPFTNWSTAATNIQDAIDAANAGDFIVVSNGTYSTGGRAVYGVATNRVVIYKAVTVQSVNGSSFTSIAGTGDRATPGIRCAYLTNGAALIGFTLANGATRFTGDVFNEQSGGGVWCEANSAIISNCVITGDYANQYGGAAYRGSLFNSILTNNLTIGGGGSGYSNTMFNCILTKNFASQLGGGAMFSTLSNCLLVANSCSAGGNGGGAAFSTLTSCIISNNSVPFGNGGGVYFGATCNSLISSNRAISGGGAYSNVLNNCVLKDNYSGATGGGAYGSTLINCTVVSNTASGWGGGLYGGGFSNSIVYYNYAPKSRNYLDGSTDGYTTNFFCCTVPLDTHGVGNITNEPAFVDMANGNYHLQSSSPCINAGNNSYVTNTTDLDGNPRISGGTVDIGAYEYQTPASVLSYAWAQQYGLPTDGTADYADTDGTGINNWQKWIAGLDPTNPASVLAMQPPVATNNSSGITVTWQSVNTRTYYLQRATDFAAQPSFTSIHSNLLGRAGTTSYTDTTATNGGPFFYRVGVQ